MCLQKMNIASPGSLAKAQPLQPHLTGEQVKETEGGVTLQMSLCHSVKIK